MQASAATADRRGPSTQLASWMHSLVGVRIVVAIAMLLISATTAIPQSIAPAERQEGDEPAVAARFAELRSLIGTGEKIIVTKADGTSVRGTLESLSDSSLDVLETATPSRVTRFTEKSARAVRVVRRDSSLDGLLYGVVSGFAPPFLAWAASGSGTKPSTAIAVIGGGAVVGGVIGWLSDRTIKEAITAYQAPPAATFEELRPLTAAGDRLLVTSRTRRVRGRLSNISDAALALEGGTAPLRMSEVLEVQVVRPDRWWPGVVAGAATGLALTRSLSYAMRCSNQGVTSFRVENGVTVLESPCFDFDPPARDYVLLGVTGAVAGGLIDWLWQNKTTVFRAAERPTRTRARVDPIISHRARGLQVSLSF